MSNVQVPQLPVTVLAGFLGSGKTTLLNRVLSAAEGRRIMVLVNDFGEINIDAELITQHDGETLSLSNGCVCCSIADDLGAALERVLSLRPRPRRIQISKYSKFLPGTSSTADVLPLRSNYDCRSNCRTPY